jgi:phosphoglycerate dehydrogenase-like enzyme
LVPGDAAESAEFAAICCTPVKQRYATAVRFYRDAFAKQPLPEESELWNLPNVIITPRIAGITSQKWPALLPVFADNLKRFINGEPLKNLVDKELGY